MNAHGKRDELDLGEDFARSLFLDPSLIEKEIKTVSSILDRSLDSTQNELGLSPGISVIIPVYKGASTILRSLNSLLNQTASHNDFETILIVNGPDDGCYGLIREFQKQNKELDIKLFYTKRASAGGARNLGIDFATKKYITFVDADDEVGPRFIENFLSSVDDDVVVLCPIRNVVNGVETDENLLLKRIAELAGSSTSLNLVPWALSFNACKAFPSEIAKSIKYNPRLKSGEDVVYFAHLLSQPDCRVVVPESCSDVSYFRHIVEKSVSRGNDSFDFLVAQRLDVVSELRKITDLSPESLKARMSLEASQLGFVKNYLSRNPSSADDVEREIALRGILNFPWSEVNSGKAKHLAFSYCFAPFSDTSAAVAAKAIAERRKIVDVISNNMHPVRRIDPLVSALADRWIDQKIVINAKPSFAGWDPICEFVFKAVEEAELAGFSKGGYDTVYSRVLWVGSHLAAGLYKLRHPQVKWTAEFSDPLRTDAEGKPRSGAFTANNISTRLLKAIRESGLFSERDVTSLFDLVEMSTFVIADELIFTNENQLEYMVDGYSESVKKLVREKAIVRHHPVPPQICYEVVKSSYHVPEHAINLAFFGSFYANRSLTEVLVAISNLSFELKRQVRLHIFCNKVGETKALVNAMGLTPNVYVEPYLSYLEFLNAARKFDVLIVNDVVRSAGMSINPFLPSKYSDYLGTGRPIWGLVEEGSPLSLLDLAYKSEAGNGASIFETLKDIISSRI